MSATSPRSRACVVPVLASRRNRCVPMWRTPGRVATFRNASAPGTVSSLMAAVTSGPMPPGASRISREVRSGNW